MSPFIANVPGEPCLLYRASGQQGHFPIRAATVVVYEHTYNDFNNEVVQINFVSVESLNFSFPKYHYVELRNR